MLKLKSWEKGLELRPLRRGHGPAGLVSSRWAMRLGLGMWEETAAVGCRRKPGQSRPLLHPSQPAPFSTQVDQLSHITADKAGCALQCVWKGK